MSKLQFSERPSPSEAEFDAALAANDIQALKRFVVGSALFWSDRIKVEILCIQLNAHPDDLIRGNTLVALSHLARRFRELSVPLQQLIEAGLKDDSEYVRNQAWVTADEVNHFLGWKMVY